MLDKWEPPIARVPSKSDSEEPEDKGVSATSTAAKSRGNKTGPSHTQQRDRKIAHGGHHLSTLAAPYPAAVFIEGHIANPMQTVFDGPVAATQPQQPLRISDCAGEAGDTIHRFRASFLADHVRGFPLQDEDLGSMRKMNITVEFLTGPDAADLQAAMTFIDGGVLRGEKTPASNRRCLDGEWAGSL